MSFIAIPDASASDITVKNSDFWPDINLATLRSTVRLDGTVTDERLTHALVSAIISVNRDLKDWKHSQIQRGHTSLKDIPAETINEQSELVSLYLRAVYCLSRANLLERYADYDSSAKGLTKAEEQNDSITDLYRDARFAVRDILGINRVTVELI